MILLRHFQNIFSRFVVVPALEPFLLLINLRKFLSSAAVSNSDVSNAVKRLRPAKSVGLDGIRSFVINGCSKIFVPVLKFIFNLSLSQNTFPSFWSQEAIVPVSKKKKKLPLIEITGPLLSSTHFP
jgi:hypothetical protein